MRWMTAAKLLLILAGFVVGLGSALQLSRYPARLRADLGREEYTELIFSQDGKTLVGLKLIGQSKPLTAFPFSGKGGRVSFHIWDVRTGRETRAQDTELTRVFHVVPSPDGHFLAATHPQGLTLWDLATGQERRPVLEGDWGWGSELRFSADSRLLALRVDARSISLVDTMTGARLATLKGEMPTVAFAPDGRTVAFADVNDGGEVALSLWDVKTERRTQLVDHPYPANWVTFSPDGNMLATAWTTGKTRVEVELWDVRALKRLSTFTPVSGEVARLEFSPDSRLLVALGHEEVTVSDVGTRPPQRVLDLEGTPLFSREGELMLDVNSENARVTVWHTATLRKSAVLHWETGDVKDPILTLQDEQVSQEGSLFALVAVKQHTPSNPLTAWFNKHVVASPDDSVSTQLWDAMTGKHLATIYGKGILSSDGRTLLTVSLEDDLRLWDLPPCYPIEYRLGLALSAFLLFVLFARACFTKLRGLPALKYKGDG
jgi:WD40 repeat protein